MLSLCRTEEEERRDRKKYQHKAKDAKKKLQVLQSLRELVCSVWSAEPERVSVECRA